MGAPRTLEEFWTLAERLDKGSGGGHLTRLRHVLKNERDAVYGKLSHGENYSSPLSFEDLHKPELVNDLIRTHNIGRKTLEFFMSVLIGDAEHHSRIKYQELVELRRLMRKYPGAVQEFLQEMKEET